MINLHNITIKQGKKNRKLCASSTLPGEPPTEFCTIEDSINLLFRRKYKLTRRESKLAGKGIFTEEFIPKDAIIATSTEIIDRKEISSLFCPHLLHYHLHTFTVKNRESM